MSKKQRIIYTGTNGFPFGSAPIQRQIQISKALIEAGFKVTVINRRSTHTKETAKREKLKVHGYYQNIEYYYSSLVTFKPTNFVLRNLLKILGIVLEFLIIFYYKFFKSGTYLLYRSSKLSLSKYYYRLGKIFNLQVIYDYVEFYDSLGNRDKINYEELNKNFDYQFHNYADKVIVISEFLKKHLIKIAPDKPFIKIPPIIDFSYFDLIKPDGNSDNFFLYCGSASYNDIIKFIIDSFIESEAIENDYKLILVINGKPEELKILNRDIINKKCADSIKILTNLPYNDLIGFYKSAKALLIPISNNIQDNARFPFKICEYTASKRPIITSDSGAIIEFFENDVNALIAKTDSKKGYTAKLNVVIANPERAYSIGNNGYNLGNEIFNYKNYSKTLRNFFDFLK